MTKKTVQRKKSNTSIENSNNLKLSIQFSLDGFSFCVSNLETKKDVFFSEYTFEKTLKTPQELLENITSIFKSDKNLHIDFKEVHVIHQNELSTLVPQEYFDEKQLNTYLKYNIKTLKSDFIAFDELSSIKANNVYIPYVNINNYLFQHFGEFEYKHSSSILIDKILSIETKNDKETMFVDVSKNSLSVIVSKQNRLLFSNVFIFRTKEDFLYYILFIAEQLKLNSGEFNLYFSGKILKESEVFKLCAMYIKNLLFLESSNPIFNNIEEPKHSNLILLYQ